MQVTAIPFAQFGSLIGIKDDHEMDEGQCWMCKHIDSELRWWQRGCPTTDLDPAPVFTRRKVVSCGAP